jgi:hypothetical protein
MNIDLYLFMEFKWPIFSPQVIRLLVDLTNLTILHYKNKQAPKEDKHEAQIYMHRSGILDILQYMAAGDEYRDYCFHVAEILYLMLREPSGEYLAQCVDGETRAELLAKSGQSQFDRAVDQQEMDEARQVRAIFNLQICVL